MADHSVDLFTAIYTELSTNAALAAIIGDDSVYDHVPPGAATPFVVIGDETAVDDSMSLMDAQEHTLTIHCWSEGASTLEVKRMQAAVRNALHDADLNLLDGICVNIRCEFKEIMRDPDGVSWHGVMRFRAVTHDDTGRVGMLDFHETVNSHHVATVAF